MPRLPTKVCATPRPRTAGRPIGPIVIPPGRRPAARREVTGEGPVAVRAEKGERLKSPCINICEFDADVPWLRAYAPGNRAWKRADKGRAATDPAEADLRLLALQARGRRKFR